MRSLASLAGFSLLLLISCKKENSQDSPLDQQNFAGMSAQANADAQVIFDDAFNNVLGVNSELGIGGTGVFGTAYRPSALDQEPLSGANEMDSLSCLQVTLTPLAYPNRFPLRVTLDFGSGCTDAQGLTRSGKIITDYSGPLLIPGNSASTHFENYRINNIQVFGNQTIRNTGESSVAAFTLTVTQARILWPNGNRVQWNSSKTIRQVAGMATPRWPPDDAFEITGSANGSLQTASLLFAWGTRISSPLLKKFSCRWFTQGKLDLLKGSDPVASLDYGTGNCDNLASLSVNGKILEISLH